MLRLVGCVFCRRQQRIPVERSSCNCHTA
jgi:hypothetical protein